MTARRVTAILAPHEVRRATSVRSVRRARSRGGRGSTARNRRGGVARCRGRRASADRRGLRTASRRRARASPSGRRRWNRRGARHTREPRRRARAANACRHRCRPGPCRRTDRRRRTRRRARAVGSRGRRAGRPPGAGRSGHRPRGSGRSGTRCRATTVRRAPVPAHASGIHVRSGAPSVVEAISAIAPRAATAGPARRNQRDSTMVDGPPPAAGRWREEGEAGIVRSGTSLPLIRPACYARADVSRTPRGREAGENPAQSRYGEPPSGGSPVADLTVHARTFERKVGRTVHTIP